MQGKIQFDFTTHLWQYSQDSGCVFASLPIDMPEEIRKNLKWQTAIWYDKNRSA